MGNSKSKKEGGDKNTTPDAPPAGTPLPWPSGAPLAPSAPYGSPGYASQVKPRSGAPPPAPGPGQGSYAAAPPEPPVGVENPWHRSYVMGGAGDHQDASLVVPTAQPAMEDFPTPSYRIASCAGGGNVVSGSIRNPLSPFGQSRLQPSQPPQTTFPSGASSYQAYSLPGGPGKAGVPAPHPEDRQVHAEGMCTFCGSGVQKGFTFCPNCGTRIGTPSTLFDLIDSNHDGLITRAEFNRALSPIRLQAYRNAGRGADMAPRARAVPVIRDAAPYYHVADTSPGRSFYHDDYYLQPHSRFQGDALLASPPYGFDPPSGHGYARELYRYTYPVGVSGAGGAQPIVFTTPGYPRPPMTTTVSPMTTTVSPMTTTMTPMATAVFM
mmetsp:Transcript_19049/g.44464  ORF Transcript_19049/g.44464 Transcript_19049/m.44464 type:complete len:380 (-) Transcript_19049:31-1170(-)